MRRYQPGDLHPRAGRKVVSEIFHAYLESGGGQVFYLADRRLGEGPLTLGVEFPADTTLSDLGVSEGCHLEPDGVDLRLGCELVLRTAEIAIWEPEPVGQTAPPDEILRRLDALINLMRPLVPPDGLAGMIPHAAGLANGEPPGARSINASMNAVARLAMPRLCQLSEGLNRNDQELLDQAVAGLVGLGPGLTPSGDDLLGGLLVALRAMPGTASHLRVDALAGCITRHAAVNTTRISSAMLEQSAKGHGSASQHRLLHCLLEAESRSGPANAALDVIRNGHTSGWDALAGILLGVYLGLRMKQTQAPTAPASGVKFPIGLQPAGTPA